MKQFSKSIDFSGLPPSQKKVLPSIAKSSKLLAKYKGKKSEAQLLREAEMKRMTDGLEQTLMMHKPVELSAICGVLGLKTLEKSVLSMEYIMNYAREGAAAEEISEEKVTDIVNAMCEAPLYEYLRLMGNPLQSETAEPKHIVLRLWKQGITSSSSKFVPHYVQREIPQRYNDIESKDITRYTTKLKNMEDKVKITEYRLHANHDYRNALIYFQEMNELRAVEQEARDHLINELEISRAKVLHTENAGAVVKLNILDLEHRYSCVALHLTEQLAVEESVCERYLASNLRLVADVQKVSEVLRGQISEAKALFKYITRRHSSVFLPGATPSSDLGFTSDNHNHSSQMTIGLSSSHSTTLPGEGGGHKAMQRGATRVTETPAMTVVDPASNEQQSSPSPSPSPAILELHQLVCRYHGLREQMSKDSVERDLKYVHEIERLEYIISTLERQLSDERGVTSNLSFQLERANADIVRSRAENVALRALHHQSAAVSWTTAAKYAAQLKIHRQGFHALKPFLHDGLRSRDLTMRSNCELFSTYFDIFSEDEVVMVAETAGMSREDIVSEAARKAYIAELAKKKKKLLKKAGTKGNLKKKLTKGSSSASISSRNSKTSKTTSRAAASNKSIAKPSKVAPKKKR